MGNKIDVDKANQGSKTPNKISVSKSINIANKNKSAQKDGLYAEERLFENFDSKLISYNFIFN